jgi:hypothetical protein
MAAAAATVAPMEQVAMSAKVATRPRGARHGRNGGIAARGAAAVPAAEAVIGSLINKQG